MAQKYSKLEKFFVGLILLCVLALIYTGVCGIIFFRKKDMAFVINSHKDYYIVIDKLERENNKTINISKNNFKHIIERELNLSFYIYLEKDIKSNNYSGLTLPIIRTIIIDSDVHGYEYYVTFAHEAIHLTQFIQEERYVCFETFKYLYESEKLHNVGVWYATKQLYGYYSDEYNISDLIIDYLTKN